MFGLYTVDYNDFIDLHPFLYFLKTALSIAGPGCQRRSPGPGGRPLALRQRSTEAGCRLCPEVLRRPPASRSGRRSYGSSRRVTRETRTHPRSRSESFRVKLARPGGPGAASRAAERSPSQLRVRPKPRREASRSFEKPLGAPPAAADGRWLPAASTTRIPISDERR